MNIEDFETPIDWNPYNNNYTSGTRAMAEGNMFYRQGQYKKASAKLNIAISRFEACANFLNMYKLGENIDINTNLANCRKAIEKCNGQIKKQSKVV